MQPKVIIIGGLPGTGKTTIATKLSQTIEVPVYTKDLLEAAIVRINLTSTKSLNGVGYELLKVLANESIANGQSCILDCIATSQRVKQFWSSIVNRETCYIECVCSDPSLHEERIKMRKRNIPGWYELTWEDVLRIKEDYKPWSENRLILDAKNEAEENLTKIVEYVKR